MRCPSKDNSACYRPSAGSATIDERQLDVLLARLAPGDTLIVSELSPMGRSVGEIMTIVDTLAKKHMQLVAIKEVIRLG